MARAFYKYWLFSHATRWEVQKLRIEQLRIEQLRIEQMRIEQMRIEQMRIERADHCSCSSPAVPVW